jgi:hypothetical protein
MHTASTIATTPTSIASWPTLSRMSVTLR